MLYTGQDMFLIGPPGPLGRRLATTFASLLNKPYEVLVLHRDVSAEADLRQGREIRYVADCAPLGYHIDALGAGSHLQSWPVAGVRRFACCSSRQGRQCSHS